MAFPFSGLPDKGRTSATILKKKIAQIRAGMPGVFDKKDIGDGLVSRTKARFLTATAPDGTPWREYSAKSRKRATMLVNTRSLFNAIEVIKGRPAGRFASATGVGFRIGIGSYPYMEANRAKPVDPAIYGRVHQQGNSSTPSRPFIGVNVGDREFVLDKVRRALQKLID